MKRKMMMIGVWAVLAAACSTYTWEDTVIRNTSGQPVVFRFNNREEQTLSPGERVVFKTEPYQYLASYSPEKRVYFALDTKNGGYTGEFLPREAWTLGVRNTLEVAVSLRADGWMDDLLEIPPQTDTVTGTVYTENPVFTVTTAAGYAAFPEVTKDAEKQTFTVVIKKRD
jgi:hypothetical protein